MKHFIIFLVLGFPILGFSQPSWHISTIDADGDEGYYCSLSLDNMNRPHISYVRWYNPNGEDLKYAYYDGNNWNISVVFHSDLNYLNECSLALDNNNIPHISFYDYYLKYATLVGGNWQISNVDSQGRLTAIAVDSLNHPHIAYSDDGFYGLKYASFDGSSWIIQTVDSQYMSGSGNNNSITTDSQNNPHISYCQDAIGQLRYAHKVGSNWTIEYPDPVTGSTGLSTSICLNSQGWPCISHCEPLRYCSKATGTWQVQQIDSSTYIQFTSLALDSNDYPHIAYCKSSALYLANWNGSTWQIETVDPTTNAGMYCSLKYDTNDNPHIAYQMNYAYDQMYAWYGEGSLGVNLQAFSAQPSQNGIKLAWQASNTGPAQLSGFNLYRINLSHDPEKKYVKLNSNLITGNSPYAFLDSSPTAHTHYQYRLWAYYTDGSREEIGTTECSAGNIQPAAFSLLAVYPNPAKSMLTCRVSLFQSGTVSLKLYDISGRLVLSKRMDLPTGEQDLTVGLGKLARGVYTVQLESGGALQNKRIVVTR